jgi:hypothetical protein
LAGIVLSKTRRTIRATVDAVGSNFFQIGASTTIRARRFGLGTFTVWPSKFARSAIDAGGFFRNTNTSTPFTAWASFTFTGIGNAFHFGIRATRAITTPLGEIIGCCCKSKGASWAGLTSIEYNWTIW